MRSEQEMMDLILNTAREDDRIRAVLMSGSRCDPNARPDVFQDYDIVYLVTDVASFRDDAGWIDRFGERMILQLPDAMQDPPPPKDGSFGYLMQFADGNRIDLGLYPIARLDEFRPESLSRLLLDKDGLLPPLPPPSDRDHLPRPPSAKAFADCCNEFWWACPYVAKGLWREEIVYAKFMLEQTVRVELVKMLTWYAGIESGFSRGPGKFGKHLDQVLEPELWDLLLETYADAGNDTTWDALFAMGRLFRRVGRHVAEHFCFEYPEGDDERVSAHLRHVRSLPKDATEMY